MTKTARESNIDLLKIIAIAMVVVLHYNNVDMGGAFQTVSAGSFGQWVLMFAESLSIIAVNVFVLISGYFMAFSKKRSYWKPIQLLAQVMLFSVAVYLLKVVVKADAFSLKGLFVSFLPCNWFCVLYIVLYLVSPVLNMVAERLTAASYRTLLVIMFLLFSVWATGVDSLEVLAGNSLMGLSPVGMYGSQFGYTIVQFVFLYLLGGYFRRYPVKSKTWALILSFVLNVIALTVVALWKPNWGDVVWSYANPIVVVNAGILFVLFSRIRMPEVRIITMLSSASFTVYLLHSFLFRFCKISVLANINGVLVALHMIVSVIGIYVVCWLVHMLYAFVTKPLWKFAESKIRLPLLQFAENEEQDTFDQAGK